MVPSTRPRSRATSALCLFEKPSCARSFALKTAAPESPEPGPSTGPIRTNTSIAGIWPGAYCSRISPACSWTQKISYTVSDSRQLSVDPAGSGSFVSEFQGRRAPLPSSDFPFQFLNQTRRQRVNYQSDATLPSGHLLTAGADYE